METTHLSAVGMNKPPTDRHELISKMVRCHTKDGCSASKKTKLNQEGKKKEKKKERERSQHPEKVKFVHFDFDCGM